MSKIQGQKISKPSQLKRKLLKLDADIEWLKFGTGKGMTAELYLDKQCYDDLKREFSIYFDYFYLDADMELVATLIYLDPFMTVNPIEKLEFVTKHILKFSVSNTERKQEELPASLNTDGKMLWKIKLELAKYATCKIGVSISGC